MTTKFSRQTELQDMINARMCNRPVAIVGMSALFPDAPNLHQYWDNIINKIDSIIEVPKSRWNIEDYYDIDTEAPDKTYCKRGGFIPDIEHDAGYLTPYAILFKKADRNLDADVLELFGQLN